LKHRRDYTIVLVAVLATTALCACDRKAERADATNPEPANANATANSTSQSAGSTATGSGPLDENQAQNPDICQLVQEGYGPDGEVGVRAEVVASGLEVPWGLMFIGDGNILVTERPGRLRLVQDGRLVDEPVATFEVAARGEGGLLDVLAHPEFDTNHQFYLYRTVDVGGQPANQVEMWQLSQDGESLGTRHVETILDDIPAARFHNGGRMRIGPDGMLYVGTGDAKDPDSAQNPGVLSGKILRLTADGEIPPDNPFDNAVYITGVRNPQGFDWRDASTMVVTDHGPSGELGRTGHDEVNIAQAGTNLGWPTIYGCEDNPEMRAPSITWETAVPPGGAAIYTGDAIPEWTGSLLIGALGSEHLHRVVFEEGGRQVEHHEVYFRGGQPEGYGRLRDVTMGPDGHLYVTTSNCDGRGTCPPDGDKILRILPQ
jgi:glucose/arabinose dehydrogenase